MAQRMTPFRSLRLGYWCAIPITFIRPLSIFSSLATFIFDIFYSFAYMIPVDLLLLYHYLSFAVSDEAT